MKIPFTIDDSRFTPRIRRLDKDGASMGRVPPASRLHATRNPQPASLPNGVTGRRCLHSTCNLQPATFHRSSERGVALVVTLILLSVTLVMAVAFLAISRRERGSVSTETDSTTASLAADAALARAEAQIVSSILVTTNPYLSSLLVSTNYINDYGFVPNDFNPTNVNYNYVAGGGVLSAKDLQENIANLFYLPRPPVYATNYLFGYNELQFYLDLNRNGRYDTNGIVTNVDNNLVGMGTTNLEVGDPEWIGILEHPDAPHSANNPFIARYAFIVVPADSLDLNSIHNQALQALQTGNANVPSQSGDDEYSRDQGVGTWELNLAAFLTDLNTNRWDPYPGNPWNNLNEPYRYPEGLDGSSVAFDDARNLVAWRYNYTYGSLVNARGNFGDPAAFISDGIDGYGVGSQFTFDTNYLRPAGIGINTPWLGSNNTNNFFSSPSDLFNTNKSSIQFVNNLYLTGTSNSTYDRYTFYRLLGQLGTDSSTEAGKLNLNYANAVVDYNTAITGLPLPTSIGVVPGMETNLFSWAPLDFFTAAADKLLHTYSTAWYESSPSNFMQTYYGMSAYYYTNIDGLNVTNPGVINQIPAFGITNIPVYVNGSFVYSPAVNRLVQLAANIYDASTNTTYVGMSNYPSVFRPVFWVTNEFNPNLGKTYTDVYIRGYQCLQSPFNFTYQIPSSLPPAFTTPVDVNTLPLGINNSNVWGVPWIIGAKKGLPNFNAFEMVNSLFVERELQVTRNSSDVVGAGGTFPYGRTYTTNQMYIMNVSNYLGAEEWNSYASNYNGQVAIQANNYLTVMMVETNGGGGFNPVPFNSFQARGMEPMFMYGLTNMTSWSGYLGKALGDPSFVLPLLTNTMWLTNSVFYYGSGPNNLGFPANSFIPTFMDPSNYYDVGISPLPQFDLLITNRLQAYILDTHLGTANPIVLDYVQLGGMDDNLNVNQALADNPGYTTGLWSTNFYSSTSIPQGVIQQILTSQNGSVPTEDNDGGAWNGSGGNNGDITPAAQQAFFAAFFSPSDTAQEQGGPLVSNYDLSVQAPYTPMRNIVQKFVFEANDPLVHYLSSDLNDFAANTNGQRYLNNPPLDVLIGTANNRYMPWGSGNTLQGQTFQAYNNSYVADANSYNLSYKDPLVSSSDNWDFPTNKYPGVGWLGRVHRGTPWQTVYLKSSNIWDLAQSGVSGVATWPIWTGNYNAYDALNSAPVQDRLLFDLFTAAPDEAAMHGQLNVNVDAYDVSNTNAPFDRLAGLASWSALLSGAIAFSNSAPDSSLYLKDGLFFQDPIPNPHYFEPQYNDLIVQPSGLDPTNSQVGQIVWGINIVRTNFVGEDGLHGVFEHAGDVLATAQLAEQSPFLHWQNSGTLDSEQQQHGISDEMYEWLPQQMMSLVTVSGTPQSPPRYVVYCYGQTLKPAPGGVVESGTFFGLCTNYQVTSESASRAIIRVVNAPTPANPNAAPHIVLEQYNPLPPD